MQKLQATDSVTGKTVTFEWYDKTPPTDNDIAEIFSSVGIGKSTPKSAPTPKTAPKVESDETLLDAMGYNDKKINLTPNAEAMNELKGFNEFIDSPQDTPKSVGDFLTRNVPVSGLKMAKGMAKMPVDIGKAVVNSFQPTDKKLIGLMKGQPEPDVRDMAKGLVEMTGASFGLYNPDEGKWINEEGQSWGYNYLNNLLKNPVEHVMGMIPVFASAWKVKPVVAKKMLSKAITNEMKAKGVDAQTAALRVLVKRNPEVIKTIKDTSFKTEAVSSGINKKISESYKPDEFKNVETITKDGKETSTLEESVTSDIPKVGDFLEYTDVNDITGSKLKASGRVTRVSVDPNTGKVVPLIEVAYSKSGEMTEVPMFRWDRIVRREDPMPMTEGQKFANMDAAGFTIDSFAEDILFDKMRTTPEAELFYKVHKDKINARVNELRRENLGKVNEAKTRQEANRVKAREGEKDRQATEKAIEERVASEEETKQAIKDAADKAEAGRIRGGFEKEPIDNVHNRIVKGRNIEQIIKGFEEESSVPTGNPKAEKLTQAMEKKAPKPDEKPLTKTVEETKLLDDELLGTSPKKVKRNAVGKKGRKTVHDKVSEGIAEEIRPERGPELTPPTKDFSNLGLENNYGVSDLEGIPLNNPDIVKAIEKVKAKVKARNDYLNDDSPGFLPAKADALSGQISKAKKELRKLLESSEKPLKTFREFAEEKGFKWEEVTPGGEIFNQITKDYAEYKKTVEAETLAPPVDVVSTGPSTVNKKSAPKPKAKIKKESALPWQMTKAEYLKKKLGSESNHRQDILDAIKQGEEIPASVLKDYPGLAQKAYEASYGKMSRGSFSLKKKNTEPDFSHITDPQERATVEAVHKMYQAQRDAAKAKNKTSYDKVKNWITKHVLDVRGNAKRALLRDAGELGKEAAMNSDLIAGASGKAGAIIEEAHKKVFRGLSSSEYEALADIIQSKRTIEIDSYKTGMKHPHGLGGDAHKVFLKNLKDTYKLTSEQVAKLEKASEAYFDTMRGQLKDLYDNGIITKGTYDNLIKKNYSPREFLQHLDPEFEMNIGGKRINVTESGIKQLDEGSIGLLEHNPERLLNQVVARTQSRIFRNEANKSLYKIASEMPEGQGFVSINKKGLKDPVRLTTFIDGEKYSFYVDGQFAKDWVVNDPLINSQLANILQWVSGAKITKAIATGYNPAFVLTNMPRDLALIWTATGEYSPHLPVAFGQMARDLVTVSKDVITRKGRVKDFVNEGGGMSFLTHYGKFRGKGPMMDKINAFGNIMSWVGETSELWSRLALRERAIRNGKIGKEATHIARDYLDFNQGGNMVKAIDNVVPYFNASVQGTRSLVRGAIKDPKTFTYKAAQLGTLATGLYFANQINKECLDSITDREKEANFIITTPWKYTDADGQERHLYFKIAKDQGQRVITGAFESLLAFANEGKKPTEQMLMAINDFLPIPGLPPTIKTFLSYLTNRDMWTYEEVWKGPEGIEPSEEFHTTTNPGFVKAGQATGMSPARLENAMGNITPYSNPFINLVGAGVKDLFGSLPDEVRDKSVKQMLTENPSIRRVFSSTNPYTPYRKEMEEGAMKGKTENFKVNRDFDKLVYDWLKDKTPDKSAKIDAYLENLPDHVQDRLEKRAENIIAFDKLPDRTWWRKLSQVQQPEARAEIFYKRWSKASTEEKKRLEDIINDIPGIASDRFDDRMNELAEAD